MWAHGDMKIQIPQFLGLTQLSKLLKDGKVNDDTKIQIPQKLGLTQRLRISLNISA